MCSFSPGSVWSHWRRHGSTVAAGSGALTTTVLGFVACWSRHLLLARKAITNLDSILKSRDITLPAKICLVKAMVFPVVMYGCES